MHEVTGRKNEEMIITSSRWFLHNKLTLNATKTVKLYFNLNHDYVSNNNNIDSVKLLGIHMDAKLNWNRHTDEICKKNLLESYTCSES